MKQPNLVIGSEATRMGKNGIPAHIAATLNLALILLLCCPVRPAGAGTVDPSLREKLAALGPSDEVAVIIKLAGKADLDDKKDKNKSVRRSNIIKALRETADASQKHLKVFLEKKKTRKLRQLWILNGMAATVPVPLIDELADFPGVEAVTLDAVVNAPVTAYGTAALPEWNITAVKVQQLWDLGFTGQGVVVANMDSGVDPGHPDLQGRWRGGSNSWFDPNGEHASPADLNGHGTQTMGIMVGGNSGGTSIGVAPGATWIAVKIFNDQGQASFSAIHQGYQWLLDPDGNSATNDAADVVNNSWGLQDQAHGCITEFQADVVALKAAGIALTFSAGNDGPAQATSVSPANYPESFSVGALDSTGTILNVSSRGASACGDALFPTVVAPGVNVRTSDLFLGIAGAAYATVTGTSFAAPHAAGAMALLLSAFPEVDVSVIETALMRSATDLAAAGPDDTNGYGLIEIPAAYHFLKQDKIAVYLDGSWHADVGGNGQWDEAADSSYLFGFADALPVSGDWNAGGTAKLGVYDPATALWYLDYNGNGAWDGTPADQLHAFGFPGAIPVTGDWNGTGIVKIGVYDPLGSTWYLDYNGNGVWDCTPADKSYYFGFAGAIPATGDWNGSGIAKIGVYDPHASTWYLDWDGDGEWDGTPADRSYHFGFAGAVPVTGDWNGTGTASIGVFRDAEWYLDMNGDGHWDSGEDARYTFGMPGAKPLTGNW